MSQTCIYIHSVSTTNHLNSLQTEKDKTLLLNPRQWKMDSDYPDVWILWFDVWCDIYHLMFQETRRSRHCSWWLPHTLKTPSIVTQSLLPNHHQRPLYNFWLILLNCLFMNQSQRLVFCRFGDAKKFQAELDSATHRVQVRIEMSLRIITLKSTVNCSITQRYSLDS